MKISEIGNLNLNETAFKLSDNSITAQVNGKTKAVINDVQAVKSIQFSKKVELNIKFKGQLNKYFDSLYIAQNGSMYYIIDQKYHELVAKMAANGDNTELQTMLSKVKELSDNSVSVIFLNIV